MEEEMNSRKGRRDFIKNSTLASLGFLAFTRCSLGDLFKESSVENNLIADKKKYLDLPEGFCYKIISKSGSVMSDGLLVPGRPDGMGAFEGLGPNEVVLIRNHENSPTPFENSAFGKENGLLSKVNPGLLYDPGNMERPGLGGTTTLIYDEAAQTLKKQMLTLAGTYRNCAGGVAPWGSWLSCEEDVTSRHGMTEKDHGFVFEVPASARGLVTPVPIKEMGRFNHEAVAVHPETSIVYMTEDRPDGLIYRFLPAIKEKLAMGGRVQILTIDERPSTDTRNWDDPKFEVNKKYKVRWIDIDDVLSPEDDLRFRGFKLGAARFARGEGVWFGKDELYFSCTIGGPGKWGQIFRYKLSPDEGNETEASSPGTLELFVESTDKGVLNMCDNLTITPWGDLMVCEDNGGDNRILGVRQDGSIYTFGMNKGSDSEFAGIVFSPSGKTLFVNIQENGDTVAITGPWETLK